MALVTKDELRDAFAEGIRTTTEEKWVNPDDIQDPKLRDQYQAVCAAQELYRMLASAFNDAIYED